LASSGKVLAPDRDPKVAGRAARADETASGAVLGRSWLRRASALSDALEQPSSLYRAILDRPTLSYAIAVGLVAVAVLTSIALEDLTGRFLAFPFYAAVVAAPWLGVGPGCVAVILSIITVEDFWTPPLFSLAIAPDEVPSFVAFVVCTLAAFAWGARRRHAQRVLEAAVVERTADLQRSNAALQVEIAERQSAENELRRSEALLAQGQQLSRTASWTLRLPAGEMQWSAQLFDLLGIARDRESPSYPLLLDHLHPDDRPLFERAVAQAFERGGDISCEVRLIAPDGAIRHVQAVGEVKHGPGGVELIGTIMDLTRRKRTEQALNDAQAELARTLRLATLAELAAAIAHEINQPLAAITANGSACLRSLARDPPLLDNAREAANCIVSDGHRAGDVIARIRALFDKQEPKTLRVDVNDVIRRVLDLSRSGIERQRVVVRTEIAEPSPVVLGDPVQLQQVLFNLTANALDAMAGVTGRQRRLKIRSTVADGEYANSVIISVEDNGVGLGPEQLERMFESFYTTKVDGIGVGLAISRSIIEAHGGEVWAAPGKRPGARVGFTLPLAPPHRSGSADRPEGGAASRPCC